MEYHMLVSTGLTLLGAALLCVSLHPTTRILRELPSGPVKTRWAVLRGFIVLFIAGDLVLKGVGVLLKESVRAVDVPARYGGEEAVVLLPHTGDAEALTLAERIRGKIGNHPFPAGASSSAGDAVRCTVSIGIAGMTPECKEAAQLLRMADTAMYRAKQQGRNRTVVFRCEREVPPVAAGGGPPGRMPGR